MAIEHEVDQRAIWPHLTATAAIFGVQVSTVSRWVDEMKMGTWVRGELHLRPSEVLTLAVRENHSVHEIASGLFDFVRETTKDRDLRSVARQEINDFLEDRHRRTDPQRKMTLAEVIEELRVLLPATQFERVRSRLEAQPRPKGADMFSADRV
jgi:tRNA(Ile)-lysidine synthase TilS/MesJ